LLEVSWAHDGAITGGALVLVGVGELGSGSLAPSSCRWCSTTGLDASIRGTLKWSNTNLAGSFSDALLLSMPAGIAAYDFLATRAAGGTLRQTGDDLLIISEAAAIAGVGAEVGKYVAVRQRPCAYYGSGTGDRGDDHLSFFSMHSTATFAMAAASGMVAQARGYSGWPWVYGAGFTVAATTSYLRLAADQHWLTDVLAGAVVGTTAGIGLPWLHRRAASSHVRILPMPGGLALSGAF